MQSRWSTERNRSVTENSTAARINWRTTYGRTALVSRLALVSWWSDRWIGSWRYSGFWKPVGFMCRWMEVIRRGGCASCSKMPGSGCCWRRAVSRKSKRVKLFISIRVGNGWKVKARRTLRMWRKQMISLTWCTRRALPDSRRVLVCRTGRSTGSWVIRTT